MSNVDEEDGPIETLKWIIAENPGADRAEIRRLFLDECKSDPKLWDAVTEQGIEALIENDVKFIQAG